MPFATYTCGVRWHVVLSGGPWHPSGSGNLGVEQSNPHPKLAISNCCCHLANRNEERFRLFPNYLGLVFSSSDDRRSDTAVTHPLVVFPCGLSAGCLAAMVTHPVDVIKTHLQLKRAERGAAKRTVHTILQVLSCSAAYHILLYPDRNVRLWLVQIASRGVS